MPENTASAKQSTGITTRKSITLMFYPTIPKSAIDNFKFHLKNEIRPVELFNIHKTIDYHHYIHMIWLHNPAQLDYSYFTVLISFLCPSHHT